MIQNRESQRVAENGETQEEDEIRESGEGSFSRSSVFFEFRGAFALHFVGHGHQP